jgi:hypothetical protein
MHPPAHIQMKIIQTTLWFVFIRFPQPSQGWVHTQSVAQNTCIAKEDLRVQRDWFESVPGWRWCELEGWEIISTINSAATYISAWTQHQFPLVSTTFEEAFIVSSQKCNWIYVFFFASIVFAKGGLAPSLLQHTRNNHVKSLSLWQASDDNK